MQPGAKYRLFVPSQLAYGERGAVPRIGPNSTLVFEVELLSVQSAE
jgi:FKBP-type peptidyl-prolyl cis-trans isomerase